MITVSDDPPENPTDGMIWLNTSNKDGDVFYRYTVTTDPETGDETGSWVQTSLSYEDLEDITDTLISHQSQIDILAESIEDKVSKTVYNTDIASKADKGWVSKQIVSAQKRTEDTVTHTFSEITDHLADTVNQINAYQETVQAWQKFDDTGMELGRSDSPFKAKLSHEKLSFSEGNTEVAFIGNNAMNITNARVQNTLSMGADSTAAPSGWFDWTMISSGLGMTWKAAQ